MQKCFQRFEALGREVIVAVAGEAKVDQFPELFALAVGPTPGTRTDKTVHPLRPQVEGEQLRIVSFQDEFHGLHPFSGLRIFPEGEHDTQAHNNILLQTGKFNSKKAFSDNLCASTKYAIIRALSNFTIKHH